MLLTHLRTRAALCALVATLPVVLAAQSVPFEAKRLAKIPDGFTLQGPAMPNPNGGTVQFTSKIHWSPTGHTVAYVAYKDDTGHPILGDKVLGHYVFADPPVFAADGDVYFRVGKRVSARKEKWWVLKNGKSVLTSDWIGTVAAGPGGRYACWIQPGAKLRNDGSYNRGRQVLVIDGKKGKKWQDALSLERPCFSADGKVVVTACSKGGRWFVLRCQKKKRKPLGKGTAGSIGSLALAAHGKGVAWTESQGGPAMPAGLPAGMAGMGKSVLVFGKQRLGQGFAGVGTPTLAADGKHVAFVFLRGKKVGVAINKTKPKAEFDCASPAVWGAKGKRVAFAANTGGQVNQAMVLYRHYWTEVKGGKWRVVTQTRRGKRTISKRSYDGLRHLTWLPDGKALAFAAKQDGKWRVVVGDKTSDPYDEVGPLHFSTDARQVAFGARSGRELWWRVLKLE